MFAIPLRGVALQYPRLPSYCIADIGRYNRLSRVEMVFTDSCRGSRGCRVAWLYFTPRVTIFDGIWWVWWVERRWQKIEALVVPRPSLLWLDLKLPLRLLMYSSVQHIRTV